MSASGCAFEIANCVRQSVRSALYLALVRVRIRECASDSLGGLPVEKNNAQGQPNETRTATWCVRPLGGLQV